MISEISPNMTKENLEELLRRERFRYQRMPLPHGLWTKGHDRSSTAKLIFPDDLEGASLLDIGCCYGYFCYEAKRRNAGRVLGLEIDPERYRHALILQKIYGVDIELRNADFLDVVTKETFDHILCLNVIHHLAEPFAALRKIADCVQQRLVIEFPSFSDERYRRTLPRMSGLAVPLLNRLPLVGVSHGERAPNFVFSAAALTHFLVNQEGSFGAIRFLQSPFRRGRVIAICEKQIATDARNQSGESLA